MTRKLSVLFAVVTIFFAADAVPAQIRPNANSQHCRGPIYAAKEVAHRAKIIQGVNFTALYQEFGSNVHGRVVLEAVLCRSGRVTDVKVIESSPANIAEFVVPAVNLIRFTPAELNWHTVSQRQSFEFLINEPTDIKNIDPTAAAGRLIEHVDILGNRRLNHDQILSWIKTRPGEPYNFYLVQKDLKAILASGYFDKATRVFTEEGVRGGVGVVFEVVELPLINEIKFQGLKINPTVVLTALDKEIEVRTGAPYRVEAMKEALALIKRVLESNGQRITKIDLQSELFNAMIIRLTFVITND